MRGRKETTIGLCWATPAGATPRVEKLLDLGIYHSVLLYNLLGLDQSTMLETFADTESIHLILFWWQVVGLQTDRGGKQRRCVLRRSQCTRLLYRLGDDRGGGFLA